jgi:hypothetical protein
MVYRTIYRCLTINIKKILMIDLLIGGVAVRLRKNHNKM